MSITLLETKPKNPQMHATRTSSVTVKQA